MTVGRQGYLSECLSEVLRCDELKSSVSSIFLHFKTLMPLDFLTIVLYDRIQHAVNHRIHATDTSVILVEELIRFSEETRTDAYEIAYGKLSVSYIPNGKKNRLVREFDSFVGIDQIASIIMHSTEVAANKYIFLAYVAWGEDRFSNEHIKLINELSDLIANAVRHIYSQLVISRLRERLILSNREFRIRMGQNMAAGTNGMKDVVSLIEQVAKLDTTVLLIGETGVGKELLANAIHHRSRRFDGPLVSINCGAIVETLIDSEFFGHEKGAFTGANAVKKGIFEQAEGGSIFLDEVSELSKNAQVKLLRVLQNMAFRRVGGNKMITVDVRVIAATNRDIVEMVEKGEFRKDLWFRLNTFPVKIPPLRERKEDIPILAEYFAKRLSIEMNLPYRFRFASNAMERLKEYDWPGNARELENVIEQALIVSHGRPLTFDSLVLHYPKELSASFNDVTGSVIILNEVIRRHIIDILKVTDGRIEGKKGAAQLLDMKPSTLRAKMRKLGIEIVKVCK